MKIFTKKFSKQIVCGICCAAMLSIVPVATANAATCTTLKCRMESVISNIFSNKQNQNSIVKSIFDILNKNNSNSDKQQNSSSNNSGNNNSANNGSANSASNNTGNNNQSNNNSSNNNTGSNSNSSDNNSSSVNITAQAKEMLDLINKERKANGLSELAWNEQLSNVAQTKAQDMVDNNYFSHTSSKYGTPFEMMKTFGISYRYAAENIAKNSSIANAHTALMNSSGHRQNILNSNYTSIGIGIVKTSANSYTIVQMFIG